MKNNLRLSMIIIASFIVILAGCSKSAASIVGMWTYTGQRAVEKANNVVLKDTTAHYTMGQQLTLTADGHYALYDYVGTTHGTYTYANSLLAVYDSTGRPEAYFPNTSVTDHTLQFSQTDTVFGSVDTLRTFTQIYSR